MCIKRLSGYGQNCWYLIAALPHAEKDNALIFYIRTSTFHVRIDETGNTEMAYILNEDRIKPAESLGNIKQTIFTLEVCSKIY